jgi:hypothetical protein
MVVVTRARAESLKVGAVHLPPDTDHDYSATVLSNSMSFGRGSFGIIRMPISQD